MKIKKRVLFLAIGFGLICWIIDAILDYYFFYQGFSLLGIFITNIPRHEIYVRMSMLVSFTIFGLVVSIIIGRQEQTESVLRESEAKFRSIVENSQPILFIIDRDGRFVVSVGEHLKALGLEPGQVVGLSALEIYAPYPNLIEAIQATWRGETVRDPHLVVQNQQGEDVHFDIFYSPHYDASGEIIGTVGMAVDITQQYQAQQKLSDREEQLRQLTENIEEAYWLRDLETHQMLYVSPAYETVWGRPSHSLIDRPQSFLEAVHPDDLPTVQSASEQQGNGRYFDEEFRIIRPDGDMRWVHARTFPVKNKAGDIYRLAGVAMDVTDLKQSIIAEQEQRSLANALVNITARLNQTLEFDMVLNLVLTSVKDIVTHDGANITLLNKDQTQVYVSHTCDCYNQSSLTPPPLHVMGNLAEHPFLQEMVATGQPLLIANTTDHPLWPTASDHTSASFVGCPIIIEDAPIGFLVLTSATPNFFTLQHQTWLQAFIHQAVIALRNAQLHEDVQTRLEQLYEAQARLVQSEKLAAIGQLVAGIAHELNNPLTSIILYSQLLNRRHHGDSKISEDVDNIVTQAQRASDIVQGLLDFARQRQTELNPLQINDVVNSTVKLLAYELRTRNFEIFLQLDDDLPLIMGDAYQLQQVFVNLLNNALQAQQKSDSKGMVVITSTVGDSHYRPVDATVADETEVISIMVEDNGPGIDPAIQKHIFDPFFTTKEVGLGTGLGLSICHGIIGEHGGHIWLESVVGKGTTFYIELPVATAVANPEPTITPPAQTETDSNTLKQRILFVDDEGSIRSAATRILGEYYQVDTAEDGYIALRKVTTQAYDLLVCDVHMPGMGGLDFYEKWQEQRPLQAQQTPILFITGDTLSAYMRKQFANIKAPSLAKPFEMETLLEKVRALLPRTLDSSK